MYKLYQNIIGNNTQYELEKLHQNKCGMLKLTHSTIPYSLALFHPSPSMPPCPIPSFFIPPPSCPIPIFSMYPSVGARYYLLTLMILILSHANCILVREYVTVRKYVIAIVNACQISFWQQRSWLLKNLLWDRVIIRMGNFPSFTAKTHFYFLFQPFGIYKS